VLKLLLLDLMSQSELEENIEILQKKLYINAKVRGHEDKRTIEIRKSLSLYRKRYEEILKHQKYN
jgi:hypothetical protein